MTTLILPKFDVLASLLRCGLMPGRRVFWYEFDGRVACYGTVCNPEIDDTDDLKDKVAIRVDDEHYIYACKTRAEENQGIVYRNVDRVHVVKE